MGYGIRAEVWGDYALFSRPELKTERVSYDVMTPSAARGILEAVFWHPGLRWRVDRIYVLNPIRFTNVRRNEVKSKILATSVREAMGGADKPLFLDRKADIQQRASLVLRDVRYVIEAHFDLTAAAAVDDNPGKFKDIARRRLEKGQCYHQPYLGCREFPAHFRLYGEEEVPVAPELQGVRELGLMLYDMDYTNPADIHPLFFRAALCDGLLEVAGREVLG